MELQGEERGILLRSKLFSGLAPEKLSDLLFCLRAQREEFAPGEPVVQEGDRVQSVGLVLGGHGHSLKSGRDGEPLIVSLLGPGSFVGILLAASRNHLSPVTVEAIDALSVIFFPAERLIFPCEKGCADHALLVRNFLDSVAEQSLTLNDRIACLLRPTVREKVLSYLSPISEEHGKNREFTIPLDRNAMARYLNVERSALSRELSRMKAEGLIDYRKNRFRLF